MIELINVVVQIFGLLIVIMGVAMAVKPDVVMTMVSGNADTIALYVLAVVVRAALGVALLVVAESSLFPLTLQVLGAISLIAALLLLLIGRDRFRRLVGWASTFSSSTARISGAFAALLGVFLVFAVA